MRKDSLLRLALLLIGPWCLTGCYTQFGNVLNRQEAAIREQSEERDSTIRKVDTVRVREREVCYWSRDLLGYPVLRCERSNYSRDWHFYHSSPWWYRNDPFWYDYDRCPRYYYYDPACRCCRYYQYSPTPPPSGGGGGGGRAPSSRTPRGRSYGIPEAGGSQATSPSGQPKSTAPEPAKPTPEPERKAPPRTRSLGVAPTSESVPPQAPSSLPKEAATVENTSAPPQSADSVTTPKPATTPRRNPRSWE